MYTVTYKTADRSRSRKYQSEQRALKSVWKWLRENSGSAVFFAPGEAPQVFNDWRELPFEAPAEVDFYSTTKWLQLRFKAFEKYGNRCACCGASPETGATLHVDHIKPRSLYPELELDLDNLQILCEACNLGKSNVSETKWR